MAKKDYRKLTVTSQPDPYSGGLDISRYESDFRSIVNNAVKSALNEGEFYYIGNRRVDPVSGITKVDIYVHPDKAGIAESSIGSQIQKFGGGANYTVTRERISKEERDLIAREEKSNNESTSADRRLNRGIALKVLGLLTALTDITRRILSSVLKNASQTAKDLVSANNMGVSYQTLREAGFIEQAYGLPKGTIPQAYSELITAFGNVTELDEDKLSKLAVVMGGGIKDMATMGLAVSDPDKLAGAIVDAFNERANAGYNSIGQYVGEQQARRELYAYLQRIFPKLADVFASMQSTKHVSSIYRGVTDYQSWKEAIDGNRGNYPQSYFNVEVTTGQLENKVESILSEIKKGVMLELNPTIASALRRIANSRIGLSASENLALNRANAKANEKYLAGLKATSASMEGKDLTVDEKAFKKEIDEEIALVEKTLQSFYKEKKDIGDLTRTLDEIRISASRRIDTIPEVAGTVRMNEAIKRTIEGTYTPAEIEEAKNELIMKDTQRLTKEAVDNKQKEFLTLYNRLKAGGMNEDDIMGYLYTTRPDLVTEDIVKTWWGGKKNVYVQNKQLTDEELSNIRKEANTVDEAELYAYMLNKNPALGKLVAKFVEELAKEGINTVGASSLLALYTEGDIPEEWEKNLPIGFTMDTSASYPVRSVNTRDTTTGEVVHKIVVDVNTNGETREVVLAELLGLEGAEGKWGNMRVRYENGKADYYIDYEGTAGSDQAQRIK
jgi:hypothetical protein